MHTRTARPTLGILLTMGILAASLCAPTGAGAAPRAAHHGGSGADAAYRTAITIDDHCPPTWVVTYDPQTGRLTVVAHYAAFCPLSRPAISVYRLNTADGKRVAFDKLAVVFSAGTTKGGRHRKQAAYTAVIGGTGAFTAQSSLLLQIGYSQIREAGTPRQKTVPQTVYTTVLLTDTPPTAGRKVK